MIPAVHGLSDFRPRQESETAVPMVAHMSRRRRVDMGLLRRNLRMKLAGKKLVQPLRSFK